MGKSSKYLVIASAVAVMGIFTGCASKNAAETTAVETTVAETTVSESTTTDTAAQLPESSDDRELVSDGEGYGNPVVDIKKMAEDFVGLIGQTDDEVVTLLGEGVIAPEDETAVSLREYNMELFGEDVITDVMYDEDKVTGFLIALSGTDMDTYEKQLTDALGTPEDTKTSTNDGSTIQNSMWKVSGANVELTKAYDVISLQIYKAQ